MCCPDQLTETLIEQWPSPNQTIAQLYFYIVFSINKNKHRENYECPINRVHAVSTRKQGTNSIYLPSCSSLEAVLKMDSNLEIKILLQEQNV